MEEGGAKPWWVSVARRYRSNRYMKHLEREELRERMRDIVFNFHEINDRSQVTPAMEEPVLHYWLLPRLVEVREEIRLRPDSREEDVLEDMLAGDLDKYPTRPDPDLEMIAGAVDRFDEPDDPYLVKYGELEHMRALLHSGEVLIRPAADFDDVDQNREIRDQELEARIHLDPEQTELTAIRHTGEELGSLKAARIELTKYAQGNYYLYCLSQALRTRHFLDFGEGYDAAVVIADLDAFSERLTEAITPELRSWVQGQYAVRYYDPLLTVPDQINVLTHKHFRYTYQREYRFAWVPPDGSHRHLDPFKIRIGSLEDIATLMSPLQD